jgi:hypothetical protein
MHHDCTKNEPNSKTYDGILSRGWNCFRLLKLLVYLLSVRASLCKTGLTAGRLTKHNVAVPAQHHGLSMAENSRDLEASRAFDIHEK